MSALASVSGKTPLKEQTAPVCRPVTVQGKRYWALQPWSAADGALLDAISRGEFALAGFRNRNLRALLYPRKATPEQERRRAARVTRQLALLRAHRLIRKVGGTHRWLLTERGGRW